ncbi:sensor histidine kinase [Streptomyces sp. GSL17-111]|uniref:sensor histidine kinase n=1 Tax=Streptomyces sp. GSL17-111 TaxID=3121596 RepID=UPI0030F465AD
MRAGHVGEAVVVAVRGGWLAVSGVVAGAFLFAATAVSLALIPLGIGLVTTPVLVRTLRAYADRRRAGAVAWGGVPVASPYRPLPHPPEPERGTGLTGRVGPCVALLRDPATWRDLQWLLVDMTAGFLTAVLPAALLLNGVLGVLLGVGLWRPVVATEDGTYWYAFVPVDSQGTALLAAALGLGWVAVSLRWGPALLRCNARLTRALLRPTRKAALARRVERLQESRHDAVDSSAAELRRIERDLHDGAQARLVAMGMNLGAVEALIEQDPQQARALLAQVRQNSAEALTELRDLVRGIHPPVLAERGLGDAVRALALRLPLPVTVEVELPGRLPEPMETAVYFAVSEVLTNAAKHAEATEVRAVLRHGGTSTGVLRVTVTDDGRGGADPARGSGLAGVRRRLGQFDGTLAVSSPPGGPTRVVLEVPCPVAAPPPPGAPAR